MRVFIDMDGVVADFMKAAAAIHDKQWPCDSHCGDEMWFIYKFWNMTREEFLRPMGYGFWITIDPTKESTILMNFLEGIYGKENLCFLSTPAPVPGSAQGKIDWANMHFPGIPVFLAQAHGDNYWSPKHMVAHRDALLIDDCAENVNRFRDAGGNAILFPRQWNNLYAIEDLWMNHISSNLENL